MFAGNLPNFFVVGAPKCGTTSMDNYLNQHPDIFMSQEKELHYFGSDIKRYPEFYCSTEKYEVAFSNWDKEKRVGETSVLYLYSRLAAREIKAFNPDSRIIIMLRNPVDMLVSYHVHLYYSSIQDIADFRKALEEGEKRRFPVPVDEDQITLESIANMLDLRVYRDVVKYSEQVKRYFNVFGRENVHIIIFDDFKKDIAAVYRDTMKFLGVDEGFQPDFRVLNASRAIGPLGAVWRPPRTLRTIARKLLTPKQREWLVELVFHKLANKIKQGQPVEILDADQKRSLRVELAPEVDKLSNLLGRDLSSWNV